MKIGYLSQNGHVSHIKIGGIFLAALSEENESLEQAAKRELVEETGIQLTKMNYIGSFADNYPFRNESYTDSGSCFCG